MKKIKDIKKAPENILDSNLEYGISNEYSSKYTSEPKMDARRDTNAPHRWTLEQWMSTDSNFNPKYGDAWNRAEVVNAFHANGELLDYQEKLIEELGDKVARYEKRQSRLFGNIDDLNKRISEYHIQEHNYEKEIKILKARIANLERIRELDNRDLDGLLDNHNRDMTKMRKALEYYANYLENPEDHKHALVTLAEVFWDE